MSFGLQHFSRRRTHVRSKESQHVQQPEQDLVLLQAETPLLSSTLTPRSSRSITTAQSASPMTSKMFKVLLTSRQSTTSMALAGQLLDTPVPSNGRFRTIKVALMNSLFPILSTPRMLVQRYYLLSIGLKKPKTTTLTREAHGVQPTQIPLYSTGTRNSTS